MEVEKQFLSKPQVYQASLFAMLKQVMEDLNAHKSCILTGGYKYCEILKKKISINTISVWQDTELCARISFTELKRIEILNSYDLFLLMWY